MPRLPQEETLRHQEAFEIYFAMGDARSLKLTADIVGVDVKTVERWSSAFAWGNRIEQRDKELIRRIQEDYKDEVLRYRAGYIELVKGMIKDCLEVDAEGKPTCKIKATSVSDLEKLINLHMKLMGDAGAPLNSDDQSANPGDNLKGGVTIVLPPQMDMSKWQETVAGKQTLTVRPN